MAFTLALLRFGLAATFVVASVAKLVGRRDFARALREFRVPGALVRPVLLGVPVLELAVGAALLPPATARWSAAAAVLAIGAFTLPVGAAIHAGRATACHCFGVLSRAPVGRFTLVRNGLLAAAAGAVAWVGPGASLTAWAGGLGRADAIAVGLSAASLSIAAVATMIALTLLRQYGRVLLRLEGLQAAGGPAVQGPPTTFALDVGSCAPRVVLRSLDAPPSTLEELVRGRDETVLIFSDTRCGACASLLPQVAAWQRIADSTIAIALIVSGDRQDVVVAERQEHGLQHVFVDDDGAIGRAFGIPGTPCAVRLDAGAIVRQTAAGGEAVHGLALTALNGGRPVPARTGDRLPAIRLRAVDSHEPAAIDSQGGLVVLWDPDCAACGAAVPQIKAWDAQSDSGPPLFVISRGAVQENRALGLHCPVLLDADDTAMRLLGARGTPAALLVDEDGRVASGIVHGMAAIAALRSAANATSFVAGGAP